MEKRTSEDLADLQALPLAAKIVYTRVRIKQWYALYDGKVYVSFSGGKDSTVLLHIARSIYPDIPAVFCDTGLEYPEIREFVKSVDNVTWIKPKMNFRKVIEKYGSPVISKEVSQKINELRHYNLSQDYRDKLLFGKGNPRSKIPDRHKALLDAPFEISSECCKVMKKRPFYAYEKETGFHPIVATMAQESKLRHQSWIRYGCNAFEAKRPVSRPMSFWRDQDVYEYIITHKVPYSAAYGDILKNDKDEWETTGCDRTGCMFCVYGCHLESEPNKFQRMKQTHPKIYNYCMKSWEDGGLDLAKVLDYVGVKYDS